MGDGDGVVHEVGIHGGDDGHGPGHAPVRPGEGHESGGGEGGAAGAGHDDWSHRHPAGGGGVQHHGIGDHAVFGHGEPGRVEDDAGAGRRGDDRADGLDARPRLRHEAGAGQPDLRQGRRRTELVAGALASPDDGVARGAAAGDGPGDPDVYRGRLQHSRPDPAIPLLLQIDGQREIAAGVSAQSQKGQCAAHPVKQPLGQRMQSILMQRHRLKGVQPAEEARRQCAQLSIRVQQQLLKRVQPAEDARRQFSQLITPVQVQRPQRAQPPEEACRQVSQLMIRLQEQTPQRAQPPEEALRQSDQITCRVYVQALQRAQSLEKILGQCGEGALIHVQKHQPAQPVEVDAPEGGDEAKATRAQYPCETQLADLAQVGRGDVRAVIHAVDCRHNGVAHLRGTAADAAASGIHREGELEAVDVGFAVDGGPGVETRRRDACRRSGEGQPVPVQGQPGGDVAQDIEQAAVAAGGRRQRQGRHGDTHGEVLCVHHRRAERRRGVGLHRHGHGQPRFIVGPRVVIGIRGDPGQGHGRGDGGRDATQGARVGVQGQPGGDVGGRKQGIAHGTVATGGLRQGHRQGDIPGPGQRRNRRHAEGRHEILLHRHDHGQGGGIGGPGVHVRVRGGQGQGHGCGGDGRGAGQGEGAGVEGQPGGEAGRQGIAQRAVAADGPRQRHHWRSRIHDIHQRRHARRTKIRGDVGFHRDHDVQAVRPAVGIRRRPGQRDRPGRDERDTRQGANVDGDDQPEGNVRGGEQGIAQFTVAAGGLRQTQRQNGRVGEICLGRDRCPAETRPRRIGDRDRHRAGQGHGTIAADGVPDGDGVV